MKFKMRLLDYFILLIFLAVIGFAAMKVFTKKSGSRILMVQTQGERYAYSMVLDYLTDPKPPMRRQCLSPSG